MYDVIQRERLHNSDLTNSNLSYSTKLINYSGLKFGALVVIEKVHATYRKLSFSVKHMVFSCLRYTGSLADTF
jgi:hypothetical protein